MRSGDEFWESGFSEHTPSHFILILGRRSTNNPIGIGVICSRRTSVCSQKCIADDVQPIGDEVMFLWISRVMPGIEIAAVKLQDPSVPQIQPGCASVFVWS